jgi:hypothetical protein
MKRSRILSFLLLVLPISAAAAPALSMEQRNGAALIPASGVYSVAFNVNLASALPNGSSLLCRAKVIPNTPFNSFSRTVPPASSGVATINGSTATCWVEIPFAWMLNDGSNGAALSYEIDAVGGSTVLRASTGQGIGVAYPSAGGSARLNVNVTF